LRQSRSYRRFTTRQEISLSRHPSPLSEGQGAIAPPLNPLAFHAEQRKLSRSLLQSHRHKSVPALVEPDHRHGDTFSATMLLKPTVRRLNTANAFVTGHDKAVIAPPLNLLGCDA